MEDNILLHLTEFYDEGIAYFYLYILDKKEPQKKPKMVRISLYCKVFARYDDIYFLL